jgi:hypothetical protein
MSEPYIPQSLLGGLAESGSTVFSPGYALGGTAGTYLMNQINPPNISDGSYFSDVVGNLSSTANSMYGNAAAGAVFGGYPGATLGAVIGGISDVAGKSALGAYDLYGIEKEVIDSIRKEAEYNRRLSLLKQRTAQFADPSYRGNSSVVNFPKLYSYNGG